METNMTRMDATFSLTIFALSFFVVSHAALAQTTKPSSQDIGFYTGENEHIGTAGKGIDWVQSIAVAAPAYCSAVKGDVIVKFAAPGMTKIQAVCWQQPTTENPNPRGHDAIVATDIKPDADGNGSFIFHADQFPNGPINLRIRAKDEGKKQDLCELQLFNQGGVVWNQGMPKTDPPAANGMKLAFADDFDGPLSISAKGDGARYFSHKPGGGDFSGWPFSNNEGPNNPFSQVASFLRIHASKPAGTKGFSGLISSTHNDDSGFTASSPCYFECRFMAQSAPGTWPAFWLISSHGPDKSCDEIDVIEAYGGWGRKNPNWFGYHATTHFWNQKDPAGKKQNDPHASIEMMELGDKSAWSTTFHTYGLLITQTDTVYYLDDIEVFRHPTGELSRTLPFNFMINYAIGGISGWHIDLDRYGNQSDMWVDYVRVYQGKKQ